MTPAPSSRNWPAPPTFPPRRHRSLASSPIDQYLAALDGSLAGLIDPALEANGIITPLGCVARAALVEAIGADLETAVRDLMLTGVPRTAAEHQAVDALGPAPALGRDLMTARRRRAVEAWQRGGESIWWWTEPLIPVFVAVLIVLVGALTPTVAIIAGMAAEPKLGTFAAALVPLVLGLFTWVAGSLAPGFGDDMSGRGR